MRAPGRRTPGPRTPGHRSPGHRTSGPQAGGAAERGAVGLAERAGSESTVTAVATGSAIRSRGAAMSARVSVRSVPSLPRGRGASAGGPDRPACPASRGSGRPPALEPRLTAARGRLSLMLGTARVATVRIRAGRIRSAVVRRTARQRPAAKWEPRAPRRWGSPQRRVVPRGLPRPLHRRHAGHRRHPGHRRHAGHRRNDQRRRHAQRRRSAGGCRLNWRPGHWPACARTSPREVQRQASRLRHVAASDPGQRRLHAAVLRPSWTGDDDLRSLDHCSCSSWTPAQPFLGTRCPISEDCYRSSHSDVTH